MVRLSSTKAQAWGIDLTIAIIIFSVAIVAFYIYALNDPNEAEEVINSLFYDGEIITDNIFSEGYPKDWSFNTVVTIGILSDNKINETKLEEFHDLAILDYNRTKRLFNTKYDYYFFLSENMIIEGLPVSGIGRDPSDPENLVKITRFTIYKNKPVTAYLYVFDE